MTSIYRKAINELLGKEQDIDSLDRACVLGLILGSMSEVERRLVASRIGELEIKVLGGGGTSENVS